MNSRTVIILCLLLGSTCAVAGCKSSPLPPRTSPAATGLGTLTQARTYLQGNWVLVSMDLFPPNEPAVRAATTGTMVYDEFSNLTVNMTLTPEAARLAERIGIPISGGVVSTKGRAVIDTSHHAISYVLEGQDAVRPATHPLDTNRPRYWETSGNTLTLQTKDDRARCLTSIWQK